MIPILNWPQSNANDRKNWLARAPAPENNILERVREIIEAVRKEGDAACRKFTARFDGYDAPIAFVEAEKIIEAAKNLAPPLRVALIEAIDAIGKFHSAQMPDTIKVATRKGVACELHWRPIERVGLYVPGGSAPLLSTLPMLAVPARIADCKTRILCTPPRKDGTVDPGILAVAALCGITQILPLGGAQAIAAMAFGTGTVPKVDKIFGPGNGYVTMAKQLVAQEPGGAAIDMPAGPSEAMVIAESGSNAAYIAADLLAQLEHGPDSQAIFLTTDVKLAAEVQARIEEQKIRLSRLVLVEQSLKNSRIITAHDMDTLFAIANLYAPEHLILHGEKAADWVMHIEHAGSVFVGAYSPETAGDYASGTNHVLPTYGYARAYGSLSLYSFMKTMSVQSLTQEGLMHIAPTLTTIANAEGLDAHAAAVTIRMEEQ